MTQQSSTIRISIAVATVMILLASAILLYELFIPNTIKQSYSEIVNKAGYQRMLSQRITLMSLMLSETTNEDESAKYKSELTNARNTFFKNYQWLSSEKVFSLLSPVNRAKAETYYFGNLQSINTLTAQLENNVARMLKNKADKEALNNILDITSYNLLYKLNEVVKIFSKNEQNFLQNYENRKRIFIIFALSLILLGIVIIYLPLKVIISSQSDLIEDDQRLKKDLLSLFNHELKTPLTAIECAIFGIKKEINIETKELKMMFDVVSNNNQKLTNIINNILMIQEINLENDNNQDDIIMIDDLIQECTSQLESIYIQKQLKIKHEHLEEPVIMHGNHKHLKSAFVNILDNAIKFSKKNSHIHINVLKDEETVTIQFKDHGEGMAQSKIKYIFNTFSQGDNSSTRSHGGLGTGLALVKLIVDAHHGSISIDSKPDEGTTVTIQLPYVI